MYRLVDRQKSIFGITIHSIFSHGRYQFLETFPYTDSYPRYALAAATSVMLWMVVKKPPADMARRVRQNKEWS